MTETATIPKPGVWKARKIVRLRKRLAWEPEQMAHILGYTPGSYRLYESGHRIPGKSARRLLDLIDAHDGLPSTS